MRKKHPLKLFDLKIIVVQLTHAIVEDHEDCFGSLFIMLKCSKVAK